MSPVFTMLHAARIGRGRRYTPHRMPPHTSPRALSWLAVVLATALTAAPRAQSLDSSDVAARSRQALLALDRYLETWNSRDPATWATSLHFPHVRPGAGPFELSRTAAEYAAGVNFEQTIKTGWHHTEWVSREVLQVGPDKVHVAGRWQRYTADDRPLGTSAITYIVTRANGGWGVQSRFAAGAGVLPAAEAQRAESSAAQAVRAFFEAWNSHDAAALAAALHYPHVRIGDGHVEVWSSAEALLAGTEPGRQRTWHQTRLEGMKVAQVTATGANLTVTVSRLGRDGVVLSTDEGIFLAVPRAGSWKIQARSMMGT